MDNISISAFYKLPYTTGNLNTLSVIKINVLLFTFVRVCFESFRRDLNEAKAVYISESVIKIP